ncbi:MAG TPA: hypothetical protein PKN36_10235 [bacterium]|nr:hypothetical protein [bacterium]
MKQSRFREEQILGVRSERRGMIELGLVMKFYENLEDKNGRKYGKIYMG